MRRARQHEEKRVDDVVVTQAAMRRDPALDLMGIRQAPKLVQHHSRRERADPHIVPGDLPPDAMNERLDGVFGGGIDGLPMDRLMARDRRGDNDVARAAGHHVRQDCADGAKDALHIDVDDPIPFVGIAARDISCDIASGVGEQNAGSCPPTFTVLRDYLEIWTNYGN